MRKEFVCVVSRCLLALGFFCAASAQAANAQTTINVPADQPTIQAGINAAVNGDTVMVAPGTYFENLNFNGKLITVTSSAGPATTIVDGGGLGPVVIFDTNESANSVLNGFTLQNGVPSQEFGGFGMSGGGILAVLSSPTITNNVITGNHAVCGAGVEIYSGSPVLRSNTITSNTQAGGACSTGGGGIEVTGDPSFPPATPQIIGNTITDNSLPNGKGGGIEVNHSASPLIQNNYISGNSVQFSGGGIALESNGSPLVVQNIIVNNSSGGLGSGAGIYLSSSFSTPTNAMLVNNTIADNNAFDSSSGIYADVISAVPVINNIVIAASGQNSIVCNPANSIFPAFSNNDVLSPGTGGQAWSANCASFATTSGDLSVDPQFVNTANGDYHLQQGSPLIDAGDNTAPNLPQQDYDGNPRVVNANGDCVGTAGTVDMGPYELQAIPKASFSSGFVSFGAQVLNTTSAPLQLTLSSTGNACLKLTALAITGDFAQTNTCGPELSPGQSCLVNVTFTPTATGTRTGALTLSGNQSGSAEAGLSGLGVTSISASASPSSIDFGNQVVGTLSSLQTLTVSNTGTTTLNISSIALSGDPDFLLFNNRGCNLGLAPGTTCSVQIGFEPTSAGAGSALLTISSNATNSPASVSLSGTGVNPANASASPLSLSFGNQVVGTQSPDQTVTVTNTGGDTLFITSLAVSGDTDFTIPTNSCRTATGVAPGASCSIQVEFAPNSGGAGSATLTLTSNAANSPVSISLSGTGIQPAISVSPAAVTFADQPINTTGPDQFITVTNPGAATLHISSTLVSGSPYLNVIAGNCGGAGVPPGGSCTIELEFTPLSTGLASATLSIGGDAPTSPTTVALSGKGIDPIGTLSPSALNFGNQQINTSSAAQTVTLSNTSTDPLSISGISVSGDFAQSNTCPATLAVGSSCTIQVTFHPTATGTRSGSLTVASNSSPPVVSDTVTGTGVDPQISVSPGSIAFGDQAINTGAPAQTITVSNPGTTTLHVNSLSVSGDPDFFTLTDNCVSGTGVVPGGTCSIQVEFAPKSVGAGSATLSIGSDAPTSPTTVALSGNGINPIGSLSTSSLRFGSQLLSTSSAAQTVTLSNTGTSPLQINSISISGDFSQTNTCPASLNAGGSCAIQVIFHPTATGARIGSVTVSSNSTQPVPAVSLAGTGVDYSVSASPASLSIRSGHQGQTSIIVSAVGGSVSNSVALSCSNLPSGASCSFSPSSVVPGATSASSSLTINTQQSGGIKTPLGTYSITVLGTGAGVVRSTAVTITITN